MFIKNTELIAFIVPVYLNPLLIHVNAGNVQKILLLCFIPHSCLPPNPSRRAFALLKLSGQALKGVLFNKYQNNSIRKQGILSTLGGQSVKK
jgi:hypothetical protein